MMIDDPYSADAAELINTLLAACMPLAPYIAAVEDSALRGKKMSPHRRRTPQ